MPHPQMKVRAVIFDLDETLIEEEASNDASALAAGEIARVRYGVDSAALLTALRKRSRELFLAGPMIDYCRDIGISTREALWGTFSGDDSSLAQLREWMPTYRLQSWMGALSELGIDDRVLAAELVEFFAADRSRRHVVFAESEQVLHDLKKNFGLALLTNGAPDIQGTKIDGSNLAGFFGTIIISGDHGFGKPDSRIFQLALKRLKVAAHEAVMIGDSLNRDIAGARAAGLRTIWINRYNRTLSSSHPIPDLELTNLRDLPTILTAAD
ncbi:MAG: HAD family hydrolase [Candidatus Binatus sp.]|uniref:HAD family hydrolase n=1 Tax=Candidatus Binatus sp. TaxID=2811406 RepID=UPI003C773357